MTINTLTKEALEIMMESKKTTVSSSCMTIKRYHEINKKPSIMTDDEHSRYCFDGWITMENTAYPCPRCKINADRVRFTSFLRRSGVEERYLNVEFADLHENPAVIRIRDKACKNPQKIFDHGASLVLWSRETGTGKTLLAIMIAKSALSIGKRVQFCSLSRVAMRVRAGYKEANTEEGVLTELGAVKMLAGADLLILDDLGAAETATQAVEKRILFAALDERQNRRLSTIITSNLDPKKLTGLVGERVLGRLQPLSVIHVDHGINYRMPDDVEEVF